MRIKLCDMILLKSAYPIVRPFLLPITFIDNAYDTALPVLDISEDLEHLLGTWIRCMSDSPVQISARLLYTLGCVQDNALGITYVLIH